MIDARRVRREPFSPIRIWVRVQQKQRATTVVKELTPPVVQTLALSPRSQRAECIDTAIKFYEKNFLEIKALSKKIRSKRILLCRGHRSLWKPKRKSLTEEEETGTDQSFDERRHPLIQDFPKLLDDQVLEDEQQNDSFEAITDDVVDIRAEKFIPQHLPDFRIIL